MNTRLLPIIGIAAALTLGACGGGSDADDAVVATINASAKTDDPADCEKLFTQAFLEQTHKLRGSAALESCELRATAADDADSVAVTKVEVKGDEATADAAFVGGGFDGQTLSLALVDEGGSWKLDRLLDFVEFDRERLLAQMRAELEELPVAAARPEVVECMFDGLSEFDDATLQEGLLSEVPKAMIALGESCARSQQAQS